MKRLRLTRTIACSLALITGVAEAQNPQGPAPGTPPVQQSVQSDASAGTQNTSGTTQAAEDPWQAPRDYWASLPLLMSAHGSLGVMTFGSISSVAAGLTTTIAGIDQTTTGLQPFIRAGSIRSRYGHFRVDFLGEQFETSRPLYALDQRPEAVTTPRSSLSLENASHVSVGFRATISADSYLVFAPRNGTAQTPVGEVLDANADRIRGVSLDGSRRWIIPTAPGSRVRRDLAPYYSGCLPRQPVNQTGRDEIRQRHLTGYVLNPSGGQYAVLPEQVITDPPRLRNALAHITSDVTTLSNEQLKQDVLSLREALKIASEAYLRSFKRQLTLSASSSTG